MKDKLLVSGILFILSFTVRAQNIYYGRSELKAMISSNENARVQLILLPGAVVISDTINGMQAYTIADHLKSTRTIFNKNNSPLLSAEYDPYGSLNKFIQEQQKEQCHYAGTYNWLNRISMYGTATRKYEPVASRFISQDPFDANDAPYTFTNSNPINFIDNDGRAPTDIKDYDNPDFAALFKHPAFPEQLHIDDDSYNTLKLIEPGNAFTGIMNIKTGDIYLAPLTPIDWIPDWKGTSFEHTARMNGEEVTSLLHTKAVTSHQQLINTVTRKNTDMAFSDFIGFHIRYSPAEPYLHLGPRSLTAQYGKFPQWTDGSKHGYDAFATHRVKIAGDLYRDIFVELYDKYRSEAGATSQSAAAKAVDELNTSYQATGGDFNNPEYESALQNTYMMGIWKKDNILKSVSTAPNYNDVIGPINDSQLPLHYASKLFDFFNVLTDLPAPMKLIMVERSSPF